MIILRLMGGLGNQLFEYASAYALSKKTGLPLLLDTSFLDTNRDSIGYTNRNYELWKFRIPNRIISKRLLFFYKIKRKLSRLLIKIFPATGVLIYDDNNFTELLNLSQSNKQGTIFLNGYWQSELLFKDFRASIIDLFTLSVPVNSENKFYIDKIKSENSVSIHIRRADYVNNSQANSYHGICSLSYYLNAINHITSSVNNPVFYIFSDDMEWVKKHLIVDNNFEVNYIEHNHHANHFDLLLMQNCKHNIIANSSFSWWGAWLNQNLKKVVIAPKKWFAAENALERYIIPTNWVRA